MVYFIHIVHTNHCDGPEGAHRKWVRKQGTKTNQGPEVQLSMMMERMQCPVV